MDPVRINSQNIVNKVSSSTNNPVEKQAKVEEKQGSVEFPAKSKALGKKEIEDAVDKANKVLFKNDTHLKFEIHEKTKDVMVKVINDETGETLKEFPPKKILDMVAKLWEIAGLFVDEKR